MRLFNWTISTNSIWTSYDCGEVTAANQGEALDKIKAELKEKNDLVNEVLVKDPRTKNLQIEMDFDNIRIVDKTENPKAFAF
jgi:uncharacterized protein YbaA (DUF1428 family)